VSTRAVFGVQVLKNTFAVGAPLGELIHCSTSLPSWIKGVYLLILRGGERKGGEAFPQTIIYHYTAGCKFTTDLACKRILKVG